MDTQIAGILVGVLGIGGSLAMLLRRQHIARNSARRQQGLGRLGAEVSRGSSPQVVGAVAVFGILLSTLIVAASVAAMVSR